ncbi:MAG: LapA family protein [Kiloniellales bacterium]|nr:LapA family protein [Kiloniellales bacterium]
MKHFTWIITLPITLLVVTFAVVNRDLVAVDLWPLPMTVGTPLFVLVLGSALAGFLIGGLVMWWSAGKQRQKLRALRRETERLARRNRSLENASQPPAAARSGAGLPVAIESRPQGDTGSARPAA